jgi:hypothetical protein
MDEVKRRQTSLRWGGTIGYGTYLLKLSFKPPKRENKMQEKILCFHPLLARLLS